MDSHDNPDVFTVRGSSARVIAWASFATAVIAASLTLATTPLPLSLALLGFPALLAAVGWALYYRPAVTVSPAGLTVRNVFQTVRIPWPAVESFDLRFGLSISTRWGTRVSAWALPSSSARPERTGEGRRAAVVRRTAPSVQRIVDSHSRFKESGALDDPRLETDRAPKTFTISSAAVLSLGVIWCAAGFIALQN